jgi:hypothetical protein
VTPAAYKLLDRLPSPPRAGMDPSAQEPRLCVILAELLSISFARNNISETLSFVELDKVKKRRLSAIHNEARVTVALAAIPSSSLFAKPAKYCGFCPWLKALSNSLRACPPSGNLRWRFMIRLNRTRYVNSLHFGCRTNRISYRLVLRLHPETVYLTAIYHVMHNTVQ